jgi:TnpA family transposase
MMIFRPHFILHSQLLTCSASEVAAMIEGASRHGTTMEVEGNYTNGHMWG